KMVDSGNLLAGHWALEQGLRELLSGPVVGEQALRGLADTLDLVWTDRSRSAPAGSRARAALGVLRRLATATSPTLETLANHIRESVAPANALVEDIAERCKNDATLRPPGRVSHDVPLQPPGRVAAASRCAAVGGPACLYWAAQVKAEVTAWSETLDRYLGWTGVLGSPPGGLTALGADAHMQRREALRAVPSLRDLAAGNVAGLASLVALQERRQPLTPHSSPLSPVSEWLERLSQAMYSAQEAARERVAAIEDLISRVRTLCSEVNMRFLYDEERRQFSTDYNVSDLRMDVGHCDLLASEARLGSFVAIARGEAPPEHWWALGRPYGSACGASTLLSWNGSMFEYLMPLLLMRTFDHSLLDKACRDAVACQMSYGHRRRVPWGISEAAFSALDSRQTYQYRAFGVPGLGIKRGLQDDLVVAPYATALALCVDAPAAVRNLRALSSLAGLKMLSDYGYYDALDYSRRPRPDVARGVVVRTYMAHHQGMILSAIDNALNDGILRDGFHRDPRVRATESLLYERIPALPAVAADRASDEPVPRPVSADAAPKAVRIETPETPTPRTDLLSNGRNSVMVTNAGGGRSTWRNAAVTRWRADTTRDAYGGFIYLRDEDTGAVWSARHHPTGVAPQRRSIAFQGDKAEFRRTDAGIETVTRIAVSPEDDVEVRHITLMNRTLRRRRVEVTSYVELALATHNADRAHPAFSKLFVQTEALPAHHGLIAWRRTRSDDETPIWALHVVSSGPNQPVGPLLAADYETDRARFIGRGRTLARPLALDGELSGTTGAVLDPAFSLRRSVTIGAGECVEIAFVTSACGSRDEAVALTDKYGDVAAVRRALEMAWTHSELELRRLGIRQEEAHRFQQLAAHVLYPNPFLRAPADRLARNTMGQAGLWAYGLSGDLPIVVVTIADGQDMQVVREVLLAHAYWRARGIAADLVLLAEQEEGTTYEQPLKDSLRRIVEAERTFIGSDQPGGMFMIPGAGMSEEDRNVLLSSARVV
ncbi:MAG: hypothetical protein FJX72_14295, partial [Armatimonadetes bacterium]|nr:hypothetical protein [Armatimonadota bacterium]